MTLLCISREGRVFAFEWNGFPVGSTIEMALQCDEPDQDVRASLPLISDLGFKCLQPRRFKLIPPVTGDEHDLLLYEEVG